MILYLIILTFIFFGVAVIFGYSSINMGFYRQKNDAGIATGGNSHSYWINNIYNMAPDSIKGTKVIDDDEYLINGFANNIIENLNTLSFNQDHYV